MNTLTQRSPYVTQQIRVKRLHPDAELPSYQTIGAAGFDLAVVEDLNIAPGEIKLAGTGLVIAPPRHHMLYITFRSSTPRKWGVTILEGIVDEDYSGDEDEISLQAMSLTHKFVSIPAGTRIAQGVFVPISRGHFVEATEMGKSRGGFGSTDLLPRPVGRKF